MALPPPDDAGDGVEEGAPSGSALVSPQPVGREEYMFSSRLNSRSCWRMLAFSLARFLWNSSSTRRMASSSPSLCRSFSSASLDSFSANRRRSICRTVLWKVKRRPLLRFVAESLSGDGVTGGICTCGIQINISIKRANIKCILSLNT